MTHRNLPRKAVILCAALAAVASLGACDSNLSETLTRLKTADVDGGTTPGDKDARKFHKEDVDLMVTTAKDLAIGEDGLLDKAGKTELRQKLEIAIVDPLDMPNAAPMDIPLRSPQISAQPPVTPEPASQTETRPSAPPVVVAEAEVPGGKSVQVGSFGSMAAAKNAWLTLQAKYPGVERYRPTYQPVTTAAGKSMVRLKVGPVTSTAQAQALCGQLGVRDTWCTKAS